MWPWCDQAAGSGKKRGRSQVPEELSISHSHGKQAQTLPLPRAAWRRERHPPRAWDSCTGEEHRLCEGNCWPSWKMGMYPKVIRPHTQKVLFVRKLPQAIFCSPYARCVLESEFSGGNVGNCWLSRSYIKSCGTYARIMNVGVICEFCWTEVEQQRDALRYYRSCTDALIMLSIMAVPTKEISNIVLNKIILNIFRITFGIIFFLDFEM